MFPVPEKRSITAILSKKYVLFKMLNNDSFAISVVGRTGKFLGADKRLLLCFPEIILMNLKVYN